MRAEDCTTDRILSPNEEGKEPLAGLERRMT